MRPDPRDALEAAGRLQFQRELPRRPHRADRMGARRADPDREEVEDADGHQNLTLRPT